ncbi:MAG: biotin--[acetyl-CoA-carboxylase] ligase [Gammaproteobacteria bacterium]|nr:biotin--[acetyl-CoA-carboxylase] ligase [Gammaproteobacteria bacterium]
MKKDELSIRAWELLNIMGDGKFHSGEMLAKKLQISRSCIFNELKRISTHGVSVQRIRGRGYRLTRPWQRLSTEEVINQLAEYAQEFEIAILSEAESSNSMLLQSAELGAPSGSVLAVELQTAGRGRYGRRWISGLGDNLTFSLLWRFECGLNDLSGLSLAVGVAVVRAIRKLNVKDIQLKWPNDILTKQGKLGGVLIEAQGDMLGPSVVVIGIGLNYIMTENIMQKSGQPACALDEISLHLPTRNKLLSTILQELNIVLKRFTEEGFGAIRREWELYNFYQNKVIQLSLPDGTKIEGIVRGVGEKGELCLDMGHETKLFSSGEVGAVI